MQTFARQALADLMAALQELPPPGRPAMQVTDLAERAPALVPAPRGEQDPPGPEPSAPELSSPQPSVHASATEPPAPEPSVQPASLDVLPARFGRPSLRLRDTSN